MDRLSSSCRSVCVARAFPVSPGALHGDPDKAGRHALLALLSAPSLAWKNIDRQLLCLSPTEQPPGQPGGHNVEGDSKHYCNVDAASYADYCYRRARCLSVSLSVTRLNSAPMCGDHSVKPLSNHFGLLLLLSAPSYVSDTKRSASAGTIVTRNSTSHCR